MGKERWHKRKFEKSTKNDNIEFGKKKTTKKKHDKMEIKFQINK